MKQMIVIYLQQMHKLSLKNCRCGPQTPWIEAPGYKPPVISPRDINPRL